MKTLELSPSQIESFDNRTTFGCQKKWFYKSILRVPEQKSPQADLGTAVHGVIESYLLSQHPNILGDRSVQREDPGAAAKAIFGGIYAVVNKWAPLIHRLELKSFTHVAGIKLNSKIDATLSDGVLDWKTTSDLSKKYPGLDAERDYLSNDIQMLTYGKIYFEFLEAMGRPTPDTIRLVHAAVQTKTNKKGVYPVFETTSTISRSQLDNKVQSIIVPLVEEMQVAAAGDVEQLVGDPKKCFRCSYRNQCSTPKKGEERTMANARDLLAKFRNQAAAPPPPPSAQPTVTESRHPAQVLPPDAPKSDPRTNADPVPGFVDPRAVTQTNVPAPAVTAPSERALAGEVAPPPEPKRRGRPPKQVIAIGESKPTTNGYRLSKVEVSHGLTLNLGNYNSAKCEVRLEAEVDGDFDTAFAAVNDLVKKKLEEELDRYSALKTEEKAK